MPSICQSGRTRINAPRSPPSQMYSSFGHGQVIPDGFQGPNVELGSGGSRDAPFGPHEFRHIAGIRVAVARIAAIRFFGKPADLSDTMAPALGRG